MNIIIKNATIVTMNDKNDIIEKGFVVIKDKSIHKVGAGDYDGNCDGFEIIDGKNMCIMPGLINCHTHSAMTLLRGYGEGLPLMKWLNEKIWPMEARFKKEHIKVGTQLAFIEMLRSGTTTFNDMYFMQEEVFNLAEEFNIRAVMGLPIIGEEWKAQLDNAVKLAKTIKNNCKDSEMTKTMIAPHSPYTLSEEALRTIAKCAKDNHKSVHIHIAETEDEINIIKDKYNMTPSELLLETGIFENKVVGAHCVHLNDNDLNILKDKGVSAVYNPQSNMKLASGVARVTEMINKGINVCLGTDGTSSNNNLNMFEEMETGAFLQKLWYKDPTNMDSYETLKLATVNGAKALDYNRLGMIEEGYKADVIMLDMNKANMMPVNDIQSNIVFSANGSEVNTVIINGELVIKNEEFIKIDEEKILYESNKFWNEFI